MRSIPLARTRGRSRGGVLAGVVVGAGIVSIATAATLSFSLHNTAAAPAAVEIERQVTPGEAAVLLSLAGITPEGLAAAGVTSLQFDTVFNTANAYCLQADRVGQIRLASKALNQAKDRATKKPLPETNPPRPTVAQAKASLAQQKNAAFNFVISELSEGQKSRLAQIRANASWQLPAYYLTVEHTDKQWLALRGALASKRFAERLGRPVQQEVTTVITAAEADGTVAQAKTDHTQRLATLKAAWKTKARPEPNP